MNKSKEQICVSVNKNDIHNENRQREIKQYISYALFEVKSISGM